MSAPRRPSPIVSTVAGATPTSDGARRGETRRAAAEPPWLPGAAGTIRTWRASVGQPSSRACSATAAANQAPRASPPTRTRRGSASSSAAWSAAHCVAVVASSRAAASGNWGGRVSVTSSTTIPASSETLGPRSWLPSVGRNTSRGGGVGPPADGAHATRVRSGPALPLNCRLATRGPVAPCCAAGGKEDMDAPSPLPSGRGKGRVHMTAVRKTHDRPSRERSQWPPWTRADRPPTCSR